MGRINTAILNVGEEVKKEAYGSTVHAVHTLIHVILEAS